MGLRPPPSAAAPAGSPADARRAELADFLRTRRAAVRPGDVGLPAGAGRRRTPGLRREEVAQLSGVGLSWYTWLEQGRDVTPSDQVLSALSRALLLSPSEREHLFLLAGVAAPVSPASDPVDDETAALIDGLLPHVAFVLSPRFDVLAHNRAAELIMADLVSAPPAHRNLLVWLFADDSWPGTPAWEQTARANLLDFRTEYARNPGDPSFESLVSALSATSVHFRDWWEQHDVQAMEPAAKHIAHRELGPLHLLSGQSRPTHAPWLRLRILVPADARTRAAIAGAL
ncbi:helix-turn-helix transcriptional regulator [Actinoplanes sp. NPDC051343]|uniref:helix-turn-helix transcriptional regulator n=1 Tax=Actinoplanes sp. NPDC051343 TaxID=3363906 RepID=UPI00379A5B60